MTYWIGIEKVADIADKLEKNVSEMGKNIVVALRMHTYIHYFVRIIFTHKYFTRVEILLLRKNVCQLCIVFLETKQQDGIWHLFLLLLYFPSSFVRIRIKCKKEQ